MKISPKEALKFRWQWSDDVDSQNVSAWHSLDGHCPACCCGGPYDGEHQESAGYYDEDEIMDWSAHSRCDPTEDEVEWRRMSIQKVLDDDALAP